MRLTTTSRHRCSRLALACAAAALLLAPVTASAVSRPVSGGKLTLPAKRKSSTGNFFTLEAYDAPSKGKPDAEFEMKVCTSVHTPPDTAIDPALFTLSVSGGVTLPESIMAAKSPPVVLKPLKPLQCTEGWLGFTVPAGKSVQTLVYDHNGTISWNVG